MKRALVTLACGSFFTRMGTITHPTMDAYARKIGVEFLIWNQCVRHTLPHFQKLELTNLLDEYDRVLYLDTDILVRDDAPDIFEIVPENRLGMLNEATYYSDRRDSMEHEIRTLGGDIAAWDGRYFNSGVMVLSQVHRQLFVPPAEERDNYKEQSYINYLIFKSGTPIFELPHRLNRLYVMDAFYGQPRFDSYFLHYAGVNMMMNEQEQLQLILHDLRVWQAAKGDYRFEPIS